MASRCGCPCRTCWRRSSRRRRRGAPVTGGPRSRGRAGRAGRAAGAWRPATVARVAAADLVHALRMARVVTEPPHPVLLRTSACSVVVEASGIEIGESRVELEAEVEGPEEAVWLSARYASQGVEMARSE